VTGAGVAGACVAGACVGPPGRARRWPGRVIVPTPARAPSPCRSLLAIGQLLSLMVRSSLTSVTLVGRSVVMRPA
jgi:hypothetical protein